MGAVAGREDRCGGTEKKRGVVAAEKYSLGLSGGDLRKKNGSGRGFSIFARARGSENLISRSRSCSHMSDSVF
jgi:hypothetical protein